MAGRPPPATLRQIEVEVDRQLAATRAQLIATAAQAGPVAAAPLPCPTCGEPMHWDGERRRRLTTTHDQPVDLTRRSVHCPACGAGLFPPG